MDFHIGLLLKQGSGIWSADLFIGTCRMDQVLQNSK